MKKITLIIFLLFAVTMAYSQNSITTKEAKDHIGETLTVTGKVFDVFTSNKGRTLINFDDKYPNQTFTVVINSESNIDFSAIKAGSILTVNGLIESYKDKPEVVIKTQDQIIKVE